MHFSFAGIKLIRSSGRIVLYLILVEVGLAAFLFLNAPKSIPGAATISTCISSGPGTGIYTVSLCFTSPSQGSTLTGGTNVTASATVSGTNPGVDRLVFYLNGNYLLTDFQSPYSFSLPTTSWVDGAYTLAVEAHMRDGFTTSRASIPVTFQNGIITPPVNNNTFSPATGTTPVGGGPLIVAVDGDGAGGERNETQVVNLISSWNPNLFLYMGDVYEQGSIAEFSNYYGANSLFFGKFRSITDPTVGNHEYLLGNANPYFNFWNNIPSYYSFTTAGWHIISLNANSQNVSTFPGSAQYQWLSQDLAANTAGCTLAFWHEPLFNIGSEGAALQTQPLWTLLAQYQADIVLNGHDHNYQRWTPLNASGQPDPNGIVEFVVGTGGHSIQGFVTTDSRMVKGYDASTVPLPYGALRLNLYPTKATYQFINISGTVLDSGTINCKRASSGGPSPTPTPNPTPTPIVRGLVPKLYLPSVMNSTAP